ncbi:MAG TPA: aminotransferase class I/II-fold pyridoxal phosphate-dependent enzyme, partial [Actinomycetota bacterium]|nr:aminotransferase class I/II-fold pyridoxal phosphate-dependent enzyme [Actinomycetota bacterium]
MSRPTSRLIDEIARDYRYLFAFMQESAWARRQGDPGICDFVVGNPHEMPVPEFAQALARAAVPRDKDWFAYKLSEPPAVEAVRATLRRSHGLDVEHHDVLMTSGAFAGLAAVLRAVVDPGDEVVFTVPTWFFYDPIIRSMGAMPVRVAARPEDWDLDVDAIAAAI